MNIIINELKKIFKPINIAIVVLITTIIWVLFMAFNIQNFPNGSDKYTYDISMMILENYGTTMDENEFTDLKEYREKRAKEATKYLLSKDEFIMSGLSTYDEYINREENSTLDYKGIDKLDELRDKLFFEEQNYLFWELQELDYLIERYDDKDFWIDSMQMNETSEQKQRYEELRNRDTAYSPLSFRILENYHSLIFGITLLILICVPILIIPIFINDSKNKVNYLQYSSKLGRKIFNKKITASVIATFLVATIQLAILFVAYKANNTYAFWNCSINSAISDMASWYDITFGQYIILSVIINYIIAFITCMISIFVSSKADTYISAIGIQIPILFAFGIWLNDRGMRALTEVFYSKFSTEMIYLLLILISVMVIIKRFRKEKIADI